MIASPGGPAIQANNLNVAQPSALVSAQPISQIEPRQHLFKAAQSFGIGVDYRVEVGSRHVDVTQGVIQDAGPIESVDFSAEPPPSVQRGGPTPDSAHKIGKVPPDMRCVRGRGLGVHVRLPFDFAVLGSKEVRPAR
jgi:hypothetical protein